ncbi:response regulator [Desulfocurvus sp. DL9XJH121]
MNTHSEKRHALISFVLTFLVLGAAAWGGIHLLYRNEAATALSSIRLDERLHTNLVAKGMALKLANMFGDLQLAASSPEVVRFLRTGSRASRDELVEIFTSLCRIRKIFDQVRILGRDGMELLRVNYNYGAPGGVPEDELQNKSGRYYFTESMKLGPGEIYVSPFDLNIENGKIELPLKPMIRVSMAVYSAQGEHLGIVILNYLGQVLLDDITRHIEDARGMPMLLNSDGHWLLGLEKTLEWGFMYPGGEDLSFAARHPSTWTDIQAADSGQVDADEGLYTFATVKVAPPAESPSRVSGAPRVWKLVHMVPREVMRAPVQASLVKQATLFVSALMVILFVALTRAKLLLLRERGRRKLEEARLAADDANRAKSDFLARMSHEIRTPMNAVIGMTHLAMNTRLTDKQRDYLSKIDISARTLLNIINDILDFSKIEARMLELEQTPFVLDDVLNDVIGVLGLQAEEKGLELLLFVRSDVPNRLVGDPHRLKQILLNLLGNALKFTDSGQVILSARAEHQDDASTRVTFSVKDTGIGISPDQAQRLFKPFSQVDTSVTRQHGGTGLGLAICQRLVELMGGSIRLDSAAGEGSEFLFTVPFGLQMGPQDAGYAYPDGLRGMRVLVVGGSESFRDILTCILDSFTFEVLARLDERKGMELLRACDKDAPFGLVFVDAHTPDKGGLELAKSIRNDESIANQPRIILVASSDFDPRTEDTTGALDRVLYKPYSRSTLFDTVASVFRNEGPAAPAPGNAVLRYPDLAGAEILLVEDNIINQEVAQTILENEGLRVTRAGNGREALERLAAKPFDAVLMDIQMPEMDGFEATRRIRADPGFRELPIIAMTAHALVGDREKSLKAGMNDHVTKPIDPAKLLRTLRQWIRRAADGPGENAGEAPPQAKAAVEVDHLPGIDVGKALLRVRDRRDVFERTMRKFAEQCDEARLELRALLTDGDLQLARSRLHALKGVAGTLEATELFRIFSEMNAQAANGEIPSGEALDLLEEELGRVAKGIHEAYPPLGQEPYSPG